VGISTQQECIFFSPSHARLGSNSSSDSIPLAWLLALPDKCFSAGFHLSGKCVNRDFSLPTTFRTNSEMSGTCLTIKI
jgi:hypothetical protein